MKITGFNVAFYYFASNLGKHFMIQNSSFWLILLKAVDSGHLIASRDVGFLREKTSGTQNMYKWFDKI